MRIVLTATAAAELVDAANWYESKAPALTARFLDQFEALTARLADNPLQFPIVHGQVRRAGFRGFPYGLFFRLRDDQVEVFACFHASRDPRRWRRRV